MWDNTFMIKTEYSKVVPLGLMARMLGVPTKWLRNQVSKGSLPGVKAGNTILFDPEVINNILADRAKGGADD